MAETILTPAPSAAKPAAPTAPAAPDGAQGAVNVGQRFPSSQGEIKVKAVPEGQPPAPATPGSARARLADNLAKVAKPAFGAPADAPTKPARGATPPATKPGDAKPAAVEGGQSKATMPEAGKPTPEAKPGQEGQDGKDGTEKPSTTEKAEAAEPTDAEIAAEAAKKGKVNPWKLVETYKKGKAEAERQLAEKTKLIVDEPARKAELDRLAKAEARVKEVEDIIRYKDYSASQEFKEKYEEPYVRAWNSAVSDLSELQVTDPNSGETRPFSPNDILELVNLPLPKARELANAAFGGFADDVMAQRKEIRGLFDKKAQALSEAKTQGAEREKAARAQAEAASAAISKEITEKWGQMNEAIKTNPKVGKYFQTVEGDDMANSKLESGYKFVDEAFALNPMDPKLTPEQRQEVLEKHNAVRHRSAGFGKVTYLLAKAEARMAELETELSQYRESTPKTDGQLVPTIPAGTGSAMERMRQNLRAKASK